MENRKTLADREIDVAKLQEMGTEELVEFAAAKDRKAKETAVELDILKAELQRRAENELEERNIKFTEFFGKTNSYVNVSCAQKLEILNICFGWCKEDKGYYGRCEEYIGRMRGLMDANGTVICTGKTDLSGNQL